MSIDLAGNAKQHKAQVLLTNMCNVGCPDKRRYVGSTSASVADVLYIL
jgi:hypothetical protein